MHPSTVNMALRGIVYESRASVSKNTRGLTRRSPDRHPDARSPGRTRRGQGRGVRGPGKIWGKIVLLLCRLSGRYLIYRDALVRLHGPGGSTFRKYVLPRVSMHTLCFQVVNIETIRTRNCRASARRRRLYLFNRHLLGMNR